jgi:hypothetical protein
MLPTIATPKYEMIVPSTGKTMTYRPYVVKEEKILLIAIETEDELAIERSIADLIKSCVETPFNIKELTNFDLEYMFTTLRSKSVGEGIKLNLECEADDCDSRQENTLNLEELRIDNLEKAKDKHIKINDDISIDMKWLGYGDRLTKAQRPTETETLINTVAKSIETIYQGEETYACKDAPFKEVVAFVESLTNDQFQKVGTFLSEVPALAYTFDYKCKACGHHNVRELRGMNDFFT